MAFLPPLDFCVRSRVIRMVRFSRRIFENIMGMIRQPTNGSPGLAARVGDLTGEEDKPGGSMSDQVVERPVGSDS